MARHDAGRALEVEDGALKASYVKEVEPPEPFHLFRVELTDVTRTFVKDETYLVVELWEPGKALCTIKRT